MRRLGRLLLLFLAGIALLVVALVAGVSTEGGRRLLAGFAGTTASRLAGLDIQIHDLGPLGAWRVEIGRVTVAAGSQPIATVEGVRADWAWADLGRLDFRPRSLTLARLDIHGLPPGDGAAGSGGLPSLAPPILPVQALTIDRINLDPPVLGEGLQLSLTAGETHTPAGAWALDLDLVRLDRPADKVQVAIRYGAAAMPFHLEAQVTEAAGGVLGRWLGASAGRVDLKLAGEGPADAWRGRLTGRVEGIAETEAMLSLAVGQGVDAEIEGSGRAAALNPDPGSIAYRAVLHWAGAGRVDIKQAGAESALGAITLQGGVDGTAIDLSGTARLTDLSRFEPSLSGRGTLAFRARGAVDDLRVTADLDSALGLPNDIAIGALTARAEVDLRRAEAIDASITGSASAIEGLPAAIGALVGTGAGFTLRVRRDPSGGISVRRLAMTAGTVELDGRAELLPAGGPSTASLAISLSDLAPLQAFAGTGLAGRAEVAGTATGDISTRALRLEGMARFEDFAVGDPRLAAMLGRAPRIDFAGLANGSLIHIGAATLTAAGGDARLAGEVDAAAGTIALTAGAGVKDIASLLPGIARGALEVDATLSGPVDRLAVAGQARLRRAAIYAHDLPLATARFDFRDLMGDAAGRLQADFGFTAGRVTLGSDLAFTGRHLLAARRLELAGPGVTLGGDLRYDTARALAEGMLDLRAASIGPAARLAGFDLEGRIGGTVRLQAVDHGQRITAQLDASGIRLDDITLAGAGLRGTIDDALGTPMMRIDLRGADLARGDNRLATLLASLQGTPKALRFDVQADGSAARSFQMALGGTGGIDGTAWRLGLDRLSGRYGDVPITLSRPLAMSGDANQITLSPAAFGIDRGSLSAEGRLDRDRIDARLQFDRIPAALARLAKPDLVPDGRLAGELRLAGPPGAVEGTLTLRAEGLRATPDLPRLSLEARADLARDRLAIDGRVTGMGEAPLILKADLPALLRLRPFAFSLPPDGAVAGQLSGPVNLGQALALALPVDDQFTGTAMIQASLEGTIAMPRAAGSVRLTGGRYVNALSEAVVEDLALAITAEGPRLVLQGSGGDGSGGTIALSGRIELASRAKFPLEATLSLRDFRAARRDDATARLNADLALGPDLASPRLTGEIGVIEADIRIPERLPPNVVVLNVREINRPGVRDDAAAPRSPAPLVIGLDLRVVAPNRIFVRGRGLDSEFGGAFTVRGDSREPQILGDLKVIRGTLDLLGKRLTVESGSIVFPGGTRLDPDIAAVATFPAGRTTGEVALSGTLSAPSLRLGSRSGLPQDEVLSQLLFGTGTASLTPFQAIQLAQSAAMLVGGGSGAGPLEQLRRRVGLDRLDVQGGTGTQGPSVEVGKYLAPNVLLKAQQGTGATGPSVGVEVELTPNISVDTRVGADAKSSIGVNLKKDY